MHMRPASAYLARDMSEAGPVVERYVSSDRMRPRTAGASASTPTLRMVADGVEQPTLLNTHQLTRLLQTPKRRRTDGRRARPRTAPVNNGLGRAKRGPFRPTLTHVDLLRPSLQPASHGGPPLTPSEKASRFIQSASRRRNNELSPFPQPDTEMPSPKHGERLNEMERKVSELSLRLLRSERKNKEYCVQINQLSLEVSRLSGYKASVVRYHGEKGAALIEAKALKTNKTPVAEQPVDVGDEAKECVVPDEEEWGAEGDGGSQLGDGDSLARLDPLPGSRSAVFEEPSSLLHPKQQVAVHGLAGTAMLAKSHPLHPRNTMATLKRLRRLEEENREMRQLNKQLEIDFESAQKLCRKLQSQVASEHKTNRSIRDASEAVQRYEEAQQRREYNGSSAYIRVGNDDHSLKKGIDAIARLNIQKTDEIAALEHVVSTLQQQVKDQTGVIRMFEAEQRKKQAELERAQEEAKKAKKSAMGDMGVEVEDSASLSQQSSITINLDDEDAEDAEPSKKKRKGRRFSSDQKNRNHRALDKEMQLKLFEKILYAEFATLPDEEHKKVYKTCMSLRHILNATHIITRSMDVSVGAHSVIPKIIDALDCNRASIFMLDEEHDQLVAEVERGLFIRIPTDAGIAGTCFQNDEVIVVNDTYADERFSKKADKKTGYQTKSLLTVPAHDAGGKVVGVVQALNKNGNRDFTLMDEVFLEMISDAIGLMLGHAHRTEHYKTKFDSQKRLLRALPKVWDRFLQEGPLQLLERIEGMVCRLVSAARCVLFVLDRSKDDPAQHTMFCSSTNHFLVDHVGWRRRKTDSSQKGSTKRTRLVFPLTPASDSIVYRVATSGQAVQCPCAYNNEWFNMNVDLDTKLPLLCTPVVARLRNGKEQVVAVLYVVMPGLPVQKNTKKLLDTIALQIPTLVKGVDKLCGLNGLCVEERSHEANMAAAKIQQYMRGYLIRKQKRDGRLDLRARACRAAMGEAVAAATREGQEGEMVANSNH